MKIFRKLLFPFSILYYLVTRIRNFFYNKGILKSQSYKKPIIVIGNLNTGGTGKSPMTLLLIEALHSMWKVAVLSRGYKRKTRGFIELTKKHQADEVGDEPLQFKLNYPDIPVAVCANRNYGITKLINKVEVILLDDAFQHRKVKGSYNIVLTSYGDLFTDDFLLPTGNLREPRKGASRADCIVVTKCPKQILDEDIKQIKNKINKYYSGEVYFTSIAYSNIIYGDKKKRSIEVLKNKSFTLVTGIAKPEPLIQYLNNLGLNYNHLEYPDHHPFTDKEIRELQHAGFILTTEKDYMRLKDRLELEEFYYLPIKTVFLKQEEEFFKTIFTHLQTYQ